MQAELSVATTRTKESTVLMYYYRFEHLATEYAKRIFNSYKISYELDDLIQDFRIKIYTSIIAYAAKWKQYKLDGRYKPVPLEYYVKSALNKRKIDFMVQIDEQKHINLSVEQDGFDYSILHTMDQNIIFSKKACKAEINGVDLVEGLEDLEARCFMLYLYGFTIGKLNKVFKSKFQVNEMINRQIAFLQTKKAQLLEDNVMKFTSFKLDVEK